MDSNIEHYIEKHIAPFKDVFEKPYEEIVEPIGYLVFQYLNNIDDVEKSIEKLKEITGDFEYTPFKWILHHIGIDNQNHKIANHLIKSNPHAIVYKYFETQEYGFNLFSELFERKIYRIHSAGYITYGAKLFRLSTLIQNEKKQKETSVKLPIISSTSFENNKYRYAIYDYGILTVYTKGEIWDADLKRYVIPKPQPNKNIKSYSFSVSQGEHKVKYIENTDGSTTCIDEKGNFEIIYPDGCIETKFINGLRTYVYPDGSIDKWDKNSRKESFDFEGNRIITN
jgi:hypothetical protein